MIKSITFTGKSGYIIKTIPEPEYPFVDYEYKKRFRDKLSEKEKELEAQYKKELRRWKKHKDDYERPWLVKNLIGRKFEFSKDKINLIFGPNASGKTTIIRAIAGYAGIKEDGFTTLASASELFGFRYREESGDRDFMGEYLLKLMKNSADVEWDGVPVYYDNFYNRHNYGRVGDLCGSVLGDDIGTELSYIMNKSSISLGQNTIFLMNRLFDIASRPISYIELFNEYVNEDGSLKDYSANDIWDKCYKTQLSRYMGFENSKKRMPATFLFDEIDKSLDLVNIYELYTRVLPTIAKKYGIQIIIISHSPIVLSGKIRCSDMYNIISIDEDYTQKCIERIKELF